MSLKAITSPLNNVWEQILSFTAVWQAEMQQVQLSDIEMYFPTYCISVLVKVKPAECCLYSCKSHRAFHRNKGGSLLFEKFPIKNVCFAPFSLIQHL